MIGWLIENASLFYALLAIAALALIAGWWMTRQGQYLLGLVAVVLLGVGLWLLATFAETDQKRIKRLVEEMAAGVREGDENKILPHLSESFVFRNMKLDLFRGLVRRHLQNRRANDVTVSKFSFPKLSRDQGTAEVEFWAHTEETMGGPVRCEAEFVLEGEAWRMRKLELFIGNTRNVWPIP